MPDDKTPLSGRWEQLVVKRALFLTDRSCECAIEFDRLAFEFISDRIDGLEYAVSSNKIRAR
jgi:hypothetical protein